jgi:DNA-3-methyladenine glycosylase II
MVVPQHQQYYPDEAIEHLRAVDPVLRALIDRIGRAGADVLGERRRGRPTDHWGVLIRAILGQQVSTRAADAMFRKLTERFGGRLPTPAELLADDPDELRPAVGLSRAKTTYLRSLAEHVLDGSLQLESLSELPDDEVITELTAVKGIGTWSADVFLIFHLGRPDVLAVGDLAIRRAAMNLYALPALPSPAELEAIAEPWRPWRTLGSLYLWRSLDALPA